MSKIDIESKSDIIKKYPPIDGYNTRIISATSDNKGSSFYSTPIEYKIALTENEYLVPDKAFWKVRAKITDLGGNKLEYTDKLALSINPSSTFCYKVRSYAGSTEIDSIDDHYSRIDTFHKRLVNNESWMQTNSDYMQGNFLKRFKSTVEKKSKDSTSVTEIDLAGIFGAVNVEFVATGNILRFFNATANNVTDNMAPYLANIKSLTLTTAARAVNKVKVVSIGGGDMVISDQVITTASAAITLSSFEMTPFSYTERVDDLNFDFYHFPCLSSLNGSTPLNIGAEVFKIEFITRSESDIKKYLMESWFGVTDLSSTFKFEVVDAKMHFFTFMSNASKDKTDYYDLNKYSLRVEDIASGTTEKTITIEPKVSAICVAFSSKETGTAYSMNKFEVKNSTTDAYNSIYTGLTDLQLTYGNLQYPLDPYKFGTGSSDSSINRLFKDNNQSLMKQKTEYNESFTDFVDRGLFMYCVVNDNQSISNNLRIKMGFTGITGNINMLILTIHKRTLKISKKDGKLASVLVKAF